MAMPAQLTSNKLHLGCGRDIRPEWVNLDFVAGDGIDVVANLDDCENVRLPFPDDSFDEFLGSHLLEHIRNPLPLLQELHRIARNGASATFKTPYGSSDDAFEDPTHFRQYFMDSYGYFSQPYYWRADYGYRGDWQPERIVLSLQEARHRGQTPQQMIQEVRHLRNVVLEMTATLVAVKPIRPAEKDLRAAATIELQLVP